MSKRTSKSSSTEVVNLAKNVKVESSWLFLMKDEIFNNGNFEIFTIPHPATNKICSYCVNDKSIYEIITYDEPYRSWFLNETVKSDGSIQIVTQINPLFLVLPILKKQCKNLAMPIEDLLSEKGYDKIVNIINNMEKVADLKGSGDIKAYKYNEGKTLDWLEGKVRNLEEVLKSKKIHVTPGAASATFISSTDNIDNEFYLKYAFELISSYLEDDLAQLLEDRFNFNPELIETLSKKRKSEAEDNTVHKKLKTEESHQDHKENLVLNHETITITDIKKPLILTAKEKARQKAANGTKSISSFFKKS